MAELSVFERIKVVLVDALDVDQHKVVLEANLVTDLKAEGLDFLDIIFRMEQAFGIKIPRYDMLFDLSPNYWQNGKATPEAVAKIKKLFPTATDISVFEADPTPVNLMKIYTVKVLVDYVEAVLASHKPTLSGFTNM